MPSPIQPKKQTNKRSGVEVGGGEGGGTNWKKAVYKKGEGS